MKSRLNLLMLSPLYVCVCTVGKCSLVQEALKDCLCMFFFALILHNDHAFHSFLVGELKLPKKELNILLWLFVSPKWLTE